MSDKQTPPVSAHPIHYTVDGEPQKALESQLTVRLILERATLKPADDFYLIEIRGKTEVRHANLDEAVPLHEGQAFVALRRGPTPVSYHG